MTMKKIKEFIVFIGIMLVPIVGGASETKQGIFWTLFILGLTALVAYDAGMFIVKPKRYGKQDNHQCTQHSAKK